METANCFKATYTQREKETPSCSHYTEKSYHFPTETPGYIVEYTDTVSHASHCKNAKSSYMKYKQVAQFPKTLQNKLMKEPML